MKLCLIVNFLKFHFGQEAVISWLRKKQHFKPMVACLHPVILFMIANGNNYFNVIS